MAKHQENCEICRCVEVGISRRLVLLSLWLLLIALALVADAKPLRVLSNAGSYVMAMSPDGKIIAGVASIGADRHNSLVLWDAFTGKIKSHWKITDDISCLDFSPDGKTLVTGSRNSITTGTVRLWNVRTGRLKKTLAAPLWLSDDQQPIGIYPVSAVAFSPDSKIIAVGTEVESENSSGGAILLDAHSGKQLRSMQTPNSPVTAMDFSPDGSTLAIFQGNGILLCSTSTGKVQRRIATNSGWRDALRFSPDRRQLWSTTSDRVLRVWDVRTGKMVRQIAGFNNADRRNDVGCSFSPDLKVVVLCNRRQRHGPLDIAIWALPRR